jgi:predicted ribosomally synthesized peptide with SipW-like signal peptide
MTNDKLRDLTRRKMLAGLGGIGAASAVAGLGTSAYFNDQENFTDNTLTAGTLDLKVDWENKYWGPLEERSAVYGDAGRPHVNAYADIGQIISGERVIEEGSLTDVLAELEQGIPLDGDHSTVPEVTADDELVDRECFANSTTHCVTLQWELPADVGNEVQSDSVAFDVGFYAEQCRHNDGNANPWDSAGRSAIQYDGD